MIPVFSVCVGHDWHLHGSCLALYLASGSLGSVPGYMRSPNRGTDAICSKSTKMEKVINAGYMRPVINTLHTPSYSKLLQVTPS